MSAVSLEIEIEIEIEIDECVLVDSEHELTVNSSSSSLIVGEGRFSAAGARGVFSTVCGITSPLITGWRGIFVGGTGKRSRRSLKES